MKVMKTYFCEKGNDKKILFEGQLALVYRLDRDEIFGGWVCGGLSVEGILEKAHKDKSELESMAKDSSTVYALKFDYIKKLSRPWKVGIGGPNNEGWTYSSVPPRFWAYAEKKKTLLVSLNPAEISDAEHKGEAMILAKEKPEGAMEWNEKSRMA